MSKLHVGEESLNLRLLNHDDLDGSTLDGAESGDRWASQDNSKPCLASSPSPNAALSWLSKRRILIRALCGVSLLTLTVVALVLSRKPIAGHISRWQAPVHNHPLSPVHNLSLYVASKPSPRFRDNLINGTKYVTASPIGGYTNQVMSYVNLLYLATLTGRVPVIGDFSPAHMHGNPGYIAVSEVYDLPRMADSLHIPILEWNDIKNRTVGEMEEIGCWSVQHTLYGADFGSGGHFAMEHEFSLDISLTPVPDSRFIPNTNHLNIMAVASLGWPDTRANALARAKTVPSLSSKHTLPPDEQMLCYDTLYYVSAVKPYEWPEEWVPAWTQVGKYMRWAPKMEELARSFIKLAFGLEPSDEFPSYISVHIRHTDFVQLCGDNKVDCFPPLSIYGEKVDEVKADLLRFYGITVDRVLVASDEEDQAWWGTVRDYGWHRIDWVAEKTEEVYNEWYPILLDSVALSLGKGFVGTTRSTLSLLAAKRVQDWEHGFVREVKLGTV